MKPAPPNNALRFLRWFCREDYLEEIEGDLIEVFEKYHEQSPGKAKWKFVWNVIHYFRPRFIKSFKMYYHSNAMAMFRHNFLLTFRNVKRYKSAFFINLTSLSTGLACTLFIYIWVHHELSVDKFHENDKQLFRMVSNFNDERVLLNTSKILVAQFSEEIPEIEEVVHSSWGTINSYLSAKENHFNAVGDFGTDGFFELFSYDLIQGQKNQVLANKNSIVLSETLALKLFHTTDNIIGKSITWQWFSMEEEVFVSGVFKDLPANSSAQFDYVLSFDVFERHFRNRIERGHQNVRTYLKLKEGTDIEQLNAKMYNFVKTRYEEASVFPEVIPYSSYYLYGHFENGKQAGGRIEYVRLFSIVAFFILLIACINFMNLSTAKASRRLKEIGIKKAAGASRKTLITQYLTESVFMAFLALLTAILLLMIFLPSLNQITGKQLSVHFETEVLLTILGITLFTGLIAGSYPALYLSAFKPVTILKGFRHSSLTEVWTRKGLVIFQFSLSVILIVSVLVVHKQIELIQIKKLGYSRDHIISLHPQGWVSKNQKTFIAEAKKVAGVIGVSSMSHALFGLNKKTSEVAWENKHPDEILWFDHGSVGHDMVEMLGIEMAEGRSFSRGFTTDTSKVIFNETAIKQMRLRDPIGKTVNISGQDWQIIGVMKDFHFESIHQAVKPTFLRLNTVWALRIVFKIAAGRELETLARLEKLHKKLNPDFQFDYKFLDEDYQALYKAERRMASLSSYFAGIAVLISCLGLFGLAAFTAERRLKEIGIRKILGAGEFGIVRLLSADFTRMVLVAIVITLPPSYFIAERWLENYVYRIDLEWWYFAGTGLTALLIAWFTVGLQTIKAARINPTQCLKDE